MNQLQPLLKYFAFSVACFFVSFKALAVDTPKSPSELLDQTIAVISNNIAADEAARGVVVDPDAVIAPEDHHAFVNRLVAGFLSQYHYRAFRLDNNFSKDVFDRYLALLDPNRSYFTKDDVDKFELFTSQLDDALKIGELRPAYMMFNHLKRRWNQRYDYALEVLETPFNFTLDDNFQYDRTESEWAIDSKALDKIWYQRVKNDYLNLKLAEKNPDEIKDILTKRYSNAKRHFGQLRGEDVFRRYMNAFSQSLEPHTNYLSPRNAEQFNIAMKLSFEGIGAVLQTEDVYTKIMRLMPAGPAEKSMQLNSGDRIVSIGQDESGDMVDVIGWRLDDVVELIRGPAKSTVRLEILPAKAGGDAKTKIVTLMRDEIKLEEQAAKSRLFTYDENHELIEHKTASLKSLMGEVEVETSPSNDESPMPLPVSVPGPKVGVIDLPKFYIDFAARFRGDKNYRSTTRDVKALIESLKQQDMDVLVIDLRDNGGGALIEATQLTGLFIDEGPVVQERNAQGRVNVMSDTDAGVAWDGPLVVLINRFSASASEIFAGAIQDYGRGVIVGQTSFGKGTVQRLLDLNRLTDNDDTPLGQIKYTTSKFYRITGASTQHKGVEPDLVLPGLIDSDTFGESAEDNALPWDKIKSAPYKKVGRVDHLFDILYDEHVDRMHDDIELQFLKQDWLDYQTRKSNKTISLNENTRLKEREENDIKSLARENARRSEKSLPALKSLDALDTTIQTNNDPLLSETLRVAVDLVSELSRISDDFDEDFAVMTKKSRKQSSESMDPLMNE